MNERLPVRLLSDREIEAIVVATSNVEERETEYMDSRIFDLAQRAKADGDETLSATYYFLSSVLRPRVEALANIDNSTNQFWVRPCSLTPDEPQQRPEGASLRWASPGTAGGAVQQPARRRGSPVCRAARAG